MAPRTHTRDNHRRNPVNAFLSNLHESRSSKTALIDATLNRAADEARDITDIELANIQALKLEIEKVDERIEQITDLEVRKAKAAELAASVDGGAIESRAAAPARVVSEEPTYHERSGNDFLADAIAAEFGGSYEARERITRYQRESMEKRDSGSANFAGLVIPQYLVSEFAGIRRPGRPVLDISTNAALPAQGMTVNIGRLTTGVTSYVQASENTAPTESSPDDTLLTVNVNTVASMFDISKQAVLRGTGVETQLLGDAVRSYQSRLDGLAISGSGSSGEHRGILNTSGINATTYTDASPTWAEFFPKLVEAIQNISSNFYGGATHIVAHPSLIGCWLRALDSTNRPLFNATAGNPFNAPGTFDRPAYDMGGLQILGIPVIADANVPTNLGTGTNETAVIVGDFRESYIWEDNAGSPLFVRFEQPDGNIAIRTVVFGFSAYTAGKYPTAFSAITGTGLITANWA
jgi:HK97 family phage major capsid protein